MQLIDIVNRRTTPEPWTEGRTIPWDDPEFGRRMLKEHLSQAHDAASRRLATIERQVQWIHSEVLSGQPAAILDLACGPGLYAQRLAALGHEVNGIDFSPASIAHAKKQVQQEGPAITYEQSDLREAAYPQGQDLVMLISGELNVFPPSDAGRILNKVEQCLKPTGKLVLEVHAPGVIEELGKAPESWYASESGLWSDSAHICLQENFWDANGKTATNRWFIIEAATGEASTSSVTTQDYSDEEYESLLTESQLSCAARYPSLTGTADNTQKDFAVIVAGKKALPQS